MQKCPHCGELYRQGQEKCYACGEPVKSRGQGGSQINPLIFIIAGGVVAIALLGFILVSANRVREARTERKQIELKRVADSVRQANIESRAERRQLRREDTEEGTIVDLELRLERVVARAERGRLNPEQTERVTEVDARISRLRHLLESMELLTELERAEVSDTIQAEAEEVRELLTRIRRTR